MTSDIRSTARGVGLSNQLWMKGLHSLHMGVAVRCGIFAFVGNVCSHCPVGLCWVCLFVFYFFGCVEHGCLFLLNLEKQSTVWWSKHASSMFAKRGLGNCHFFIGSGSSIWKEAAE